jgi:hypothetical protein
MICPNCGTELPAVAKFAFNCGHEIEAGSTRGESETLRANAVP